VSHPFDNVLRAAERALTQVVAPSLDAANPLAREQLALVLRFLRLVTERADDVADAAMAELSLALAAGLRLQPHAACVPADVRERLEGALALGRARLDDPCATAQARREAAAHLHALESTFVRFAGRADAATRRAVRRVVIEGSAGRLALMRAWHAPLALDPERSTVPEWAAALAVALQSSGDAMAPAAAPTTTGDE
jgi:hypothetical protein